ncbi:MAG: hypothetical protein RIR51_1468 [Bacteroidota bacterium]|jgi:ABC-2 type transport system permease protein
MHKILLIIEREYRTKIQKKSFWISTFLAPVLISAIYIVPIWLATRDAEKEQVSVIDESGLFLKEDFNEDSNIYEIITKPEEDYKEYFFKNELNSLVIIHDDILKNPTSVEIYTREDKGMGFENSVNNIIERKVRTELLKQAGIDSKVYEDTQVNISSSVKKISEDGGEKSSNSTISFVLSLGMGLFLYIMIILYGQQVMMGVIEEKGNRIVEVIISSVKPFQLLMGKIIGIGLVGLSQLALWILLSFGIVTGAKTYFEKQAQEIQMQSGEQQVQPEINPDDIFDGFKDINIPLMVGGFIFYFLTGYLLYAGLYAAIGSAVETPQEAQQFVLIVLLPIILSMMFANAVIMEPNGQIAFWSSIIPFTAPVDMVSRLSFDFPLWQLGLSMSLMLVGVYFMTKLSAKIYRVGILMYGKKVTFKEIAKWVFYKE